MIKEVKRAIKDVREAFKKGNLLEVQIHGSKSGSRFKEIAELRIGKNGVKTVQQSQVFRQWHFQWPKEKK